jgi:kinesin family protein 4/21/27
VGGSAGGNGKSAASLEKEIMRLQDVLKEREAEIALLEESLKAAESKANDFPAPVAADAKANGFAIAPPLLRIEPGESEEFVTPISGHPGYENTSGRSTPVSSSPIPPMNLSPKTMNQFRAIRRSLDFSGLIEFDGEDSAPPLEQDGSLERLNELMR